MSSTTAAPKAERCIQSLVARLSVAWPRDQWQDVTVLVAVSGGADSVALARGLQAIALGCEDPYPSPLPKGEGTLVLAHFNHRLRGEESDADEAFVRELAERLELRLMVGSAADDLAASGSGEGIEGAARQARYSFLAGAAAQCGARYITTAHTADDHIETALLNILRGTGLAGLAGIPRIRALNETTAIIRPLLDVTRTEVLGYLQTLGQRYRDDSTNCLEDYTRNRIRLRLLPLLERDYNPRVREAILRLTQIAGQAEDFLDQQAEAVLGVAARRIERGVEFDLKRMAHLHPALIRHALLLVWQEQGWPLQDMSFEKWEQLRAQIQNPGPASASPPLQMLPGGIRLERRETSLCLTCETHA